MSTAGAAGIERNEVMSILDKLCANGWVAFDPSVLHDLQNILPHQESRNYRRFTGDIIVGIVKPFIECESEATKEESLKRQILTMSLMSSFGWRLRDFQVRNWINGYLVDGGDVDTRQEYRSTHRRHRKRSWLLAIFQSIPLQRRKLQFKAYNVRLGTENGDL